MGNFDAETEEERHESFAVVGFTRTTGNPGRLFGSPLRNHESYVTLKVSRAVRLSSYGQDRYYGSHRGDILELKLSSAQFAELLTTMNVASGVPCTLSYIDGKPVERPPEDMELEVEKVRRTYRDELRALVSKMKKGRAEMEKILEKKSLTVADKKALQDYMGLVERHATDNAPFMLSQFEEASENVVKHAKAEIDSFVTSNVIQRGLASLSAEREPEAPQLPPGMEGQPPRPDTSIEKASDRLRTFLKVGGIQDLSIGLQAFTSPKAIIVYVANKADAVTVPTEWEGFLVKSIVSKGPRPASG